MNGAFELFAQRAGLTGVEARHKHPLFAFQKFCRDFDHLFRRFARPENDFRKTFAQRAVRIYLRKANVGQRGGLESPQDLVAAHTTGAEFFQQLNGLGRCHGKFMIYDWRKIKRSNHKS